MSASAGVRGSSSSSSSSSLKSSSSFWTTLAFSVFRRLSSFNFLWAGDSKPGESLLGSFLRLFFCSSSSFSCFSMAKRHCLVCWVCSPASLLYALSSSLEALDGSSVPSATASFTIAIDSLDNYILSLGGPSAAAVLACCLLRDCWLPWLFGGCLLLVGWPPFWLSGACSSGIFIGIDPTSPSFTPICCVFPGPVALLVVGVSWRVLGSLVRPLLSAAGSSTSAINTCDSVMTVVLLARRQSLSRAVSPLERSQVVLDLGLGGQSRLSWRVVARVIFESVVAAEVIVD